MIPLESPVPAIGTPGSESGGRKRAYRLRTAARPRKRRTSHRALPVTRLPSTLHESGRYPYRAISGLCAAAEMALSASHNRLCTVIPRSRAMIFSWALTSGAT